MFGAWGGALLCLAGTTLGSVLVLLLVRRFGGRFVYAFYPKEKIDALPILRNPKKRNLLTLVLFLPRHAQGSADLRHRADGHEHPLLPCPDDSGTVPVRHYVHGRRKCRRGKEIPLGSGCFPCDSRHQSGRTVPVQPDRQAPCAGVCRGCGTSPTAARVPPVTSPRPLFPAQERPDALIGKSGQCRRSGAPDKKRHPLPLGTEGVFSVSESPGRHSADRRVLLDIQNLLAVVETALLADVMGLDHLAALRVGALHRPTAVSLVLLERLESLRALETLHFGTAILTPPLWAIRVHARVLPPCPYVYLSPLAGIIQRKANPESNGNRLRQLFSASSSSSKRSAASGAQRGSTSRVTQPQAPSRNGFPHTGHSPGQSSCTADASERRGSVPRARHRPRPASRRSARDTRPRPPPAVPR